MGDVGIRGASAIVGVADDASPTGQLEIGGRELEAAMIEQALSDAGLTIADVDGVCHTGSSMGLAEYLGVHPRFTESTNTGGSSFEVHVEHAAAAIAAGIADVVVSVYASTPRGDRARGGGMGGPGRRPMMMGGPNPQAEWEMPSGIRMPMGAYAMAATRHMAD
jgi:acetyl-CoA acetyltransferase